MGFKVTNGQLVDVSFYNIIYSNMSIEAIEMRAARYKAELIIRNMMRSRLVELKRACGYEPSFFDMFDIFDLTWGKRHARS
jgi:hypothetical protein